MTGPKSKWARRVDRPTTVCASRNRRSPASWFAGLARLFDFIIWVSIQLEKGLAVVCLHSCFVPSSFIDEKDWFDCIVSTRFLSSLVFLEFSLKCVVLSEEWSASLVWLSIRAPIPRDRRALCYHNFPKNEIISMHVRCELHNRFKRSISSYSCSLLK